MVDIICGAKYLPILFLFSSSSHPLQVLTTALLFRGVFALILFTLALPGVLLWSPGWIAIKVLERKVRETDERTPGGGHILLYSVWCTRYRERERERERETWR